MTPITLGALISAGCLTCLGVMWWIAARSPYGWEDEATGWHEGIEPLDHSDYTGE